MNLSLNELQQFFDKIVKKLQQNGYENIHISQDYYWSIPIDDCYSFNDEKRKIVVGSLYDDYNSLLNMMKEDFVNSLDIERFASLLISISNEICKAYMPLI